MENPRWLIAKVLLCSYWGIQNDEKGQKLKREIIGKKKLKRVTEKAMVVYYVISHGRFSNHCVQVCDFPVEFG